MDTRKDEALQTDSCAEEEALGALPGRAPAMEAVKEGRRVDISLRGEGAKSCWKGKSCRKGTVVNFS